MANTLVTNLRYHHFTDLIGLFNNSFQELQTILKRLKNISKWQQNKNHEYKSRNNGCRKLAARTPHRSYLSRTYNYYR